MRATSRTAGLTLIELLLAMFIASVAAVAVFGLFLSQSRGLRQSQESMEIHDNVRVALDAVARDIRSAGFMTQQSGSLGFALRVENNCGGSATGQAAAVDANGVEFDATATRLIAPSATGNAIDAEGNLPKTSQADGCPNGSDRLSVTYRQTTQFIQMSDSNGNDHKLSFPCDGFGTCQAALNAMNIQGVCDGGPMSAPIEMCASNDPARCYTVTFDESPAGNCVCAGTGTCNMRVFEAASGGPFNSVAGVWVPALCSDPATCPANSFEAAKKNASVGAWITHSYQIMDLDGDGSTELVSSPDQMSFTTRVTAAADAKFDVIANFIDDFQVAVAYRSAPDTFLSTNLWNFPDCTPSAAPPSVVGPENCLFSLVNTPGSNNPPVAVRVTIVARSAKRRMSDSGTVENAYRPQIEDNLPNPAPYLPSAAVTPLAATCYGMENCGCGTADLPGLMQCSVNGNAQGYARRIVTETIALRNLTSVQ